MSSLSVIPHPSPNFDRRDGVRPSLAILHYTGMKDGRSALDRLCDPAAKVSAHYLVEEDGRVYGLVSEDDRAWHAGLGVWQGETQLNAHSIGIEIVNPGHEWGYRAFPQQQILSVQKLLREICERWSIKPHNVVGHSDVAPHRKDDPGELFPWSALDSEGLAFGPPSLSDMIGIPQGGEITELLESIGYGVSAFGLTPCLLAFQRRFLPEALGQSLSPRTRSAVGAVAARFARARAGT